MGEKKMKGDAYLTVGDLKHWIKECKLKDDTKVYVQMPYTLNEKKIKKANLSDIKILHSDMDGDSLYVRAWGPHLRLKEKKKNLYIEIYY